MDRIQGSSDRSREAVWNIALSLCTKCVTVLVSLLLVPLAIGYVNPSQYGIWLTLTSVTGWIAFVDLGLGNGFRNRFAEARARGEMELAREYLSTSYLAITCIVTIVLAAILVANVFVDWTRLLKLPDGDNGEFRAVFAILSAFFCMSMVVNLFSTLLTADQRPGLSAAVNAGGQSMALLSIWVMTKMTHGSLVNLALCLSGVPCIFTLVVSVIAFRFTRYRDFAPTLSCVRPRLIGDIMSLGINFFMIFVCMLVVFQLVNLVLIREAGSESVTQYNISLKYFNVLYSIVLIILMPFWSAFTDAYTKGDFAWMRRVTSGLEKIWLVSVAVGVLMLFAAPVAYRLLSGGQVEIPFSLSIVVLIYVLLQTIGNIYMYLINGIGTVRVQLIIYMAMAILSWPLLTCGCRLFGTAGIAVAPGVCFLLQALAGRVQIGKLINHKADGIWAE